MRLRLWLGLAAANGALAVVMGALAAHGPAEALSGRALAWIDTGARYQLAHAVALVAVSALAAGARARLLLDLAALGFVAGSVLFSGGLYLQALAGWGWMGPLVPVGGLAFVAGWLLLLAAALRGGLR
jgi:uncharacterized membrane protein YgdD (TMEM256/DUF423 family)